MIGDLGPNMMVSPMPIPLGVDAVTLHMLGRMAVSPGIDQFFFGEFPHLVAFAPSMIQQRRNTGNPVNANDLAAQRVERGPPL